MIGDELRVEHGFDRGARVRRVVGVPHTEDVARKQRSGTRELGQGAQGPAVVVSVGEEVAVLDVAGVRSGLDPPIRRPQRALGVVQETPTSRIQQSVSIEGLNSGLAGGTGLSRPAGWGVVVGVGIEPPKPSSEGSRRCGERRWRTTRTDGQRVEAKIETVRSGAHHFDGVGP